MLEAGDVVLATIQFADTFETKQRPAVVLFAEHGNIVVAGVTSNKRMKGVPLTRKEGAVKESVIKLNYLFTIAEAMVTKRLFSLTKTKRQRVYRELVARLHGLA